MSNLVLTNCNLVPNTTLRIVINEQIEAATRSIGNGSSADKTDREETKKKIQTSQNHLARCKGEYNSLLEQHRQLQKICRENMEREKEGEKERAKERERETEEKDDK
mmetsp:Transcript_53032/g.85850  ORF Transcript_53032/g.85850 Transcript_53032/m.85850 type:complete len:107 (+) Transcript_53032:1824-2144(+)